MRSMMINRFGDSEVFTLTDTTKPKMKSGHVLIEIKATSINTVDTMIRQMGNELGPLAPSLPAILGMDFAGIITEIADDVSGFEVGDEVYGCAGGLADIDGALAELMLADAKLIAAKPKRLSMREAAAIPLVGITAYEGLKRANVKTRQKVLVHGGSGGVGHIAVQLAKHMGADVYSTGGGEQQLALIDSLGATPINYKAQNVSEYVEQYTNGNGFDVVFDSVGGENMLNSFEAAALNAHIASTVSLVNIDLSTAHFKGLSLHVVFMLIPLLHNVKRETHGAILAELADIIDQGALTPVLDNTEFSLEQVAGAHDRLSSRKAMGKVVVSV